MEMFVIKSRISNSFVSGFTRYNGNRFPIWDSSENALHLSPSDVIAAFLEIDPYHPCDIISDSKL